MSVQAMGWVLDHSPTTGSDRLVLVSIANHAGQSPTDGAWEAWPGTALVQREARLARARTVTEALGRLVAEGHLERIINGAPDERLRRDKRPNLYRILLANGVPCGDTRCGWCGVPPDDTRGAALRPDGVPPDGAAGCRKTAPKPSVEPDREPEQQPLEGTDPVQQVFAAWLESTKRTARTVLDAKRRRLIANALQSHPQADVLDAVRGWDNSPWHRGENAERRTYNDLGLLLRDAEHIERFRDLARGPRLRGTQQRSQPGPSRLSPADAAALAGATYSPEVEF